MDDLPFALQQEALPFDDILGPPLDPDIMDDMFYNMNERAANAYGLSLDDVLRDC